MNDIKVAGMNQGQRMRYLKAGGIISFICLIFFFLAPKERLGGGMQIHHAFLLVVPIPVY